MPLAPNLQNQILDAQRQADEKSVRQLLEEFIQKQEAEKKQVTMEAPEITLQPKLQNQSLNPQTDEESSLQPPEQILNNQEAEEKQAETEEEQEFARQEDAQKEALYWQRLANYERAKGEMMGNIIRNFP